MKNNKFKIIIATIAIILILGLTYFYLFSYKGQSSAFNQNFIFNTFKDKRFNIVATKNHFLIKELKGKVIFLKVFGWDCEYCQKEIPELIQLKNKFGNAFDIIAIESQPHTKDEHLAFIEKNHINYNIVDGEKQKEFLNYLKEQYKWNGVIPMTLVIGTDGKILTFEVGYKSYSLTTLLKTTLQMLTQKALPAK